MDSRAQQLTLFRERLYLGLRELSMEMGRSEILQDASRCLRDAQLPRQSCGTLREWQLGLRATQASRTRKSAECKICESELKMKKVLLTGVAALMLCTDAMAQSATECGRL